MKKMSNIGKFSNIIYSAIYYSNIMSLQHIFDNDSNYYPIMPQKDFGNFGRDTYIYNIYIIMIIRDKVLTLPTKSGNMKN